MRIEQVMIPAIRQIVNRPKLADALFRFDKWGNPFADEIAVDPYPIAELMRADGQVVYRKLYQQWFINGYDEARFVLSSDAFGTANQVDMLLDVRPYSQMSKQAREFMSLWLLLIDPPDHTRLRRLVNRAFTPKRVMEVEAKVEHLVDQLIAEIAHDDRVDILSTFAEQLPVAVIAEMLGLPPERWDWSRKVTQHMVAMLSPFEWYDPAEMSETVAEIHDYWGSLADERRAEPQDDLLTALVQAEDEGDRLTRQELVAVIAFLMGAGHETTTNLLGNSIVHLARNPDQRALVRDNPDLWPNAVEELIRFDTSVKIAPRSALRDVEVGGETIKAGQNVLVELGTANRDPRKFDRPNELVLDRTDPSPISFGHGMHHCLGATLARQELRIGLSKFIEAFGDYTVDEDTIEWKQSATLRGPSVLDVTRGPAI